jgi:hypothetical protein
VNSKEEKMAILDIGEKVHIIERRYFNEDLRRHFVGEVTRSTENAIRVKGYVWIFDMLKGGFVKREDKRERVIYPSDRTNINILPKDVDLDALKYISVPEIGLAVTDGKEYCMNVNEFGFEARGD